MPSTKETGFLRSIGAEPQDDLPRMVFADWLEDQGETDRAELIRVQCELAEKNLNEERRTSLRVRERDLLNAHRQQWLQAPGLPVEDVVFRRGVIESLRVSEWDSDQIITAAQGGWLSTISELDLSNLSIGDGELSALVELSPFPTLRKLILSQNQITPKGVEKLASSPGFPGLKSLYLFDNPFGEDSRALLGGSRHFKLEELDLGESEEGYSMSFGQTDLARREYIRQVLLPTLSEYFRDYEHLQSAMLAVAQYWCDEANDAVHGLLVVSEMLEPTLEDVRDLWDEVQPPDPNLPNTKLKDSRISVLYPRGWHDNSGAIPLWAAFADEGGHQEYSLYHEVYSPAVLFYRHGGYEILPMRRPQLNGISPEWELYQ